MIKNSGAGAASLSLNAVQLRQFASAFCVSTFPSVNRIIIEFAKRKEALSSARWSLKESLCRGS